MRPAAGVMLAALLYAATPAALAQSTAPTDGAAVAPAAPAVAARAAVLVDLKTGRVLYAKAEHARLPVASLTKVATALVARDRYALDDLVTAPEEVLHVGGGKLGLKPGMQMKVRDLLHALLLMSGNDVAVALAAHDPLGVPSFVEAMNFKARSIGAVDTHFVNPHGLDDPMHLSSAWDMALLGREILDDRVLASMVATQAYQLSWPDGTTRVIRNHNKLLLRDPSMIGVKTGYTGDAGNCLIAAAKGPGGTGLSVVLNSPDHYAETRALLGYQASNPAALTSLTLATPRPVAAAAAGSAASSAGGPARYRWVLFPMGLLALAMLLTLRRSEGPSPIGEAAQFHPVLEPYVAAEDTTA